MEGLISCMLFSSSLSFLGYHIVYCTKQSRNQGFHYSVLWKG
uniref:Uncharacterized protein n=1 Tax=Rhizophora mucronata TaxID=61149 RepID=A0A2P2NDJ8_RHIMU